MISPLSTPLQGFIGGVLIGLSASILLVINGDVMGLSGTVASSFLPKGSATQWKLVFLSALMFTTQVVVKYMNVLPDDTVVATIPSTLANVVGGLLVGFGTKLGNGCTTGHGICGMARLSKRSWLAVMTFMATAMATAYAISPNSPFAKYTDNLRQDATVEVSPALGYAVTAIVLMKTLTFSGDSKDSKKLAGAILSGSVVALGLAVSQMISVAKIYGFLDITGLEQGTFDPTLIFVMGGGVLTSALSYAFIGYPNMLMLGPQDKTKAKKPLACSSYSVPSSTTIDAKLIGGEAIFGVGWALAGLCPGPAFVLAGAGMKCVVLQWLPAFFVGSYLGQEFTDRHSGCTTPS